VDYDTGYLYTEHEVRDYLLQKQANMTRKDAIKNAENGAIIAIKLNDANYKPVKLTLENFPAGTEFHPHGLYLFKTTTTKNALLYVISHRSDGDVIDIFEVAAPTQLKYVTSISSNTFLNINDLYVHPNGDIYITSFTTYDPDTVMDLIEKYFRMPWNKVILCTKTLNTYSCKVVLTGMIMPNGIMGFKDELYVAQTLALNMQVYKIEGKTLTFNKTIPTHSGCDNINVDLDGNLYLACHQKLLTFARHSKDHKVHAPSQILYLKRGANEFEEIFYSDGDDISGSSGAIVYNNKLYIGSVHDEGLLVCDGL